MKVLDLGAAPGSWAQYCSKKLGPKGRILGVDLAPIKLTLPNAVFIEADMRQLDLAEVMTREGIAPPFDSVLSDLAPKTIGVKITDAARSLELCELALATAERFLKPGGSFVAKMFQSDEFENFRGQLRQRFKKVEILRPQSTRKESKEIFFIALDYKPRAGTTPATDKTSADAASPATQSPVATKLPGWDGTPLVPPKKKG
jgi:23S rRNA (uridine2552-2'-O)-methyltransferase